MKNKKNQIFSAREISLKYKKLKYDIVKITDSLTSYKYISLLYKDDLFIHETFYVIYLDNYNQTIGHYKISQGGIRGTVVDVLLVLKPAIDLLASKIILAHNHPSGNIRPSDSDKTLTEKVRKASNLLDIQLLDHLIVTENTYYSFADEGIL